MRQALDACLGHALTHFSLRQSSISKSEDIVVYNRKNGRIKQDGTEVGLMASWATSNGFLYTTMSLGAGLASKACLPGPWAEGLWPGTVVHCPYLEENQTRLHLALWFMG